MFSILFGDLINAFGENLNNPSRLQDEVTKYSLYFLYLGIAAFFCAYFQVGIVKALFVPALFAGSVWQGCRRPAWCMGGQLRSRWYALPPPVLRSRPAAPAAPAGGLDADGRAPGELHAAPLPGGSAAPGCGLVRHHSHQRCVQRARALTLAALLRACW